MKMYRTNLDEQQQQKLLRIESRGFWMSYWGILIVLFINMIFVDNPIAVYSLWALFMLISVIVGASCVKEGIWDRKLDMSKKTSVLMSLVGALILGVSGILFLLQRGDLTYKTFIGLAIFVLITFLFCYICVRMIARMVVKQQNKLNAEPDDTMEKE